MINLLFIVAFIISLAVAVASVLIGHQLINSYNRDFYKNYFYYLVTFYAFAFYAIWTQLIMHELLSSMTQDQVLIDMTTNFLPIFGIPFLLISWVMLIRSGYSINSMQSRKGMLLFHILVFIMFFLAIWYVYDQQDQDNLVFGIKLIYIQIGILTFIDLIYLLVFSGIVIKALGKENPTFKTIVSRFIGLMTLGFVLRIVALVFAFSSIWILPFLIVLYFASSFIPLFYINLNSEILFEPVKADHPSEAKIELLFKKYKITKREKEIVKHICEGKTNQQIADDLFISLQTVKDHTHRIYSKIGINSRMKLVQMVNS